MGHLKDCNERYGTDLCRKLQLRLIGGQHKGRRFSRNLIYTPVFGRYGWDEIQHRKVCKPTAPTIAMYNLHAGDDSNFSRSLRRQWRIQATDLFDHWLAETGQWERMIAYINRCPTIGSKRIALVMLDIDCHEGQSLAEANQTALAIDAALTDMRIYWEPSTSGGGLHGYCMISWSARENNAQIRTDMDQMGNLLGTLTAGRAARCREVRGAPMLFEGREIVACGTWAKVPRPQTREDAESLVAALEQEVAAADALQVLTELTGLRGKSEDAALMAGSGSYSNTVSRTESVLGAEGDTYRRASRFCAFHLRSFYRAHGRLPELTEVSDAYTEAGLRIGNSDDRCLRCAYRLLCRSFNPDLIGRGAVGYLPEAAEAVRSALRSNGIIADLQTDLSRRRKVYANRGCKPSTIASLQLLVEERLAKLLACMMYDLGGRKGTWGKAQAKVLMLKVFDLRMSDKEFKAAMRWLRRNRLVELVARHAIGKCREYRVGIGEIYMDMEDDANEYIGRTRGADRDHGGAVEGPNRTAGETEGRYAVREAQGADGAGDGADRPGVLDLAADDAESRKLFARDHRDVPGGEAIPEVRPLTKMQKRHAVKDRVFKSLMAMEEEDGTKI